MNRESRKNDLIMLLVALLAICCYVIFHQGKINDGYKDRIQESVDYIDSLYTVIDSLRDQEKALNVVWRKYWHDIDSVKSTIENKKEEYEINRNNLINIPADSSVNILSRNLSKINLD